MDTFSLYTMDSSLGNKETIIDTICTSVIQIQLNLDYLDSLELDEIVQTMEGPDNGKCEY